MAKKALRIKLISYDHRLIDESAKKIVEAAKKAGAEVAGPIPLPTEKEVFTIIRSPHKYKDSREQFERRTHKRLIDIKSTTPKTMDALVHLEIPAGVEIAAGEGYAEDALVICKVLVKLPPYMSAFEVGTSFFNPKSLTENHYLTFGHNTLEYLKNYPFITVKGTAGE